MNRTREWNPVWGAWHGIGEGDDNRTCSPIPAPPALEDRSAVGELWRAWPVDRRAGGAWGDPVVAGNIATSNGRDHGSDAKAEAFAGEAPGVGAGDR